MKSVDVPLTGVAALLWVIQVSRSQMWVLGIKLFLQLYKFSRNPRAVHGPCVAGCFPKELRSMQAELPPFPDNLHVPCRCYLSPGSFPRPVLQVSSVSHLANLPGCHCLLSRSPIAFHRPQAAPSLPNPCPKLHLLHLPATQAVILNSKGDRVISHLKLVSSYLARTQNPSSHSPHPNHTLYIQIQGHPSTEGLLCYPMLLNWANMAHFHPPLSHIFFLLLAIPFFHIFPMNPLPHPPVRIC